MGARSGSSFGGAIWERFARSDRRPVPPPKVKLPRSQAISMVTVEAVLRRYLDGVLKPCVVCNNGRRPSLTIDQDVFTVGLRLRARCHSSTDRLFVDAHIIHRVFSPSEAVKAIIEQVEPWIKNLFALDRQPDVLELLRRNHPERTP